MSLAASATVHAPSNPVGWSWRVWSLWLGWAALNYARGSLGSHCKYAHGSLHADVPHTSTYSTAIVMITPTNHSHRQNGGDCVSENRSEAKTTGSCGSHNSCNPGNRSIKTERWVFSKKWANYNSELLSNVTDSNEPLLEQRYNQLLKMIAEIGRDIKPSYTNSKVHADRLKKSNSLMYM